MAVAVTENVVKPNDFGKVFVIVAVFESAVGTVFVDEPRWCFLRKSFWQRNSNLKIKRASEPLPVFWGY